MPIAYPEILSLTGESQILSWGDRETMLYALGIGLGADPMNTSELPFVYESSLKAMPTLAATVVPWGFAPPLGRMGLNPMLIVHGEQGIEFHKPFPTEASIIAEGRVLGAYDKGPKGAVIHTQTVLKDAKSGEPIVTTTAAIFARGDGGFGGPAEGAPEPHAVPTRAPDLSLDFPTRPDQALLFRLSGDRNPLHADPKIAAFAGFPRPILHGLCTYGITCRAVMQAHADFEPVRIKSHQVRFSSPVFPGETITVDLWKDGDVVSFEARIKDRGVVVIRNGKTLLG